jgi:signal transduction histidine kinase
MRDSESVLEVEDNDRASETEREKVFERFLNRRDGGEGCGLGLSIVSEIAEGTARDRPERALGGGT